ARAATFSIVAAPSYRSSSAIAVKLQSRRGDPMTDQDVVELHVVSDATGETATRVVAATEAQFPEQPFITVRHPRVDTVADLQLVLARMEDRRAVLIFTLVEP